MTICVKTDYLSTACPITDIKLILKEDYDPASFPGYSIAEAPRDINWYLLVSRTEAQKLPLTTFHLSEFEPCSLDNSFVSDNVRSENLAGRTRDPYYKKCPLQPLEG